MTGNDDEETAPQEVGWTPPPADECEEYNYDTPVGDPGDVLHFRHSWDMGSRLVDFAIIQMSRVGGRLVRVAEADIRHGELHVHVLNQHGERIARESIQPVVTQQDVDKAYDVAFDRFVEKWEEYKRRWRSGR
jgi:hypothetical protein